MIYKVWDEYCGGSEEWAHDIKHNCDNDEEYAAQLFAEKVYADREYPEEMDVWVKNPTTNEVKKFKVYVEMEPIFRACQEKKET